MFHLRKESFVTAEILLKEESPVIPDGHTSGHSIFSSFFYGSVLNKKVMFNFFSVSPLEENIIPDTIVGTCTSSSSKLLLV